MAVFAAINAGVLLACTLIQLLASAFVRLLRRYRPPDRMSDADLPYASILLPLRGADPFLARGLRTLMTQDYPDYDLRIITDNESDPARQLAQKSVIDTGFEKVEFSILQRSGDRCSLKCASLVQLASELDRKTEIVVFADADLVSHDGWLLELIAPLQRNPKIGATYGNRWFWPERNWCGSLVRYLWNVAAVVPMALCKIPWGGTFAIRADVIHDAGLLEKWSKAIVEDAPIRSALDSLGLELHFVPGLMMINREDCRLPFCLDFIKRQLTWTRLYHPHWWIIVFHATLTAGPLLAALLLVPWGILNGNFLAAAWAGAGLASYLIVMAGLTGYVEKAVRHIVEERGEQPMLFSAARWLKTILAIPLALGIHTVSVILAIFRRTVSWRGITYRIRGPWDIHMIDYRPYRPQTQPRDSNHSL